MKRRTFVLAGLALAAATAAPADPVRLSADEIDTLLRGKRIEGDWNGTKYVQVFRDTGGTIYTAEGAPPDPGKWRVNAETDTYESWWERSGWSSYAIERDGAALYWVDSRGRRYPFKVQDAP